MALASQHLDDGGLGGRRQVGAGLLVQPAGRLGGLHPGQDGRFQAAEAEIQVAALRAASVRRRSKRVASPLAASLDSAGPPG